MKRLVLYVTSDQLKTILPLVINDCVDFNVSDLDTVVDLRGDSPAKPVDPNFGVAGLIGGINRESAGYWRATNEADSDRISVKEVEPGLEPTAPTPHPLDTMKPRKMQKKDYGGKTPADRVLEFYDIKHRAVATRSELAEYIVRFGFGAGSIQGVLRRLVDKGELRHMNNHRYSIKDTKGKALKSLSDLDVVES